MDPKTIYFINNIRATIKRLGGEQERNDKNKHIIRISKMNIEVKNRKIDSIDKRNEEIDQELQELIQQESDAMSGRLTIKINQQANNHRLHLDDLERKNKEKRKNKKKEKEQKYQKFQTFWKGEMKNNRKIRDYRYQLKRFHGIIDSLPDWMERNLSTMPNNKGYIWRGCYFYGKRRAERNQPIIVFEHRKGLLTIHENTRDYYKIKEKRGKGKTKTIKTVRRRKIQGSSANWSNFKLGRT